MSCAMYRKIEGGKIELDQTQCNTTATEEAKQGSEAKPDLDRKEHLSKLLLSGGSCLYSSTCSHEYVFV